jgi:pimeloyl-ACP methyl ester carboxylesterase
MPAPGFPFDRRGLLAATEPVRALASAGALAVGLPLLAVAPRGDRHAVLVLPGLGASDVSTGTLRRWLRGLGYRVVGWELGRNRGPTQEIVHELPRLLERLHREHGSPVSIVGQSLGGIYARRLALRAPSQVRQVITLGSPFALVGWPADGGQAAGVRSLPVPSTSIYSRWDGIVDWRACLQQPGPTSENVAVRSGHLGMGFDPAVLWVIADRLAQPADAWQPFRRTTRLGLGALFPGDGAAAQAGWP